MKEKEALMKVTNKLNIITLHQGKIVLAITHEHEIVDFVLYNRALGNVVTSNQMIQALKIDQKYNEKSWVHFRNGVIVLCTKIIELLEEAPIFLKNFLRITWVKCNNLYTITLNLEANMILNWMQLQTRTRFLCI